MKPPVVEKKYTLDPNMHRLDGSSIAMVDLLPRAIRGCHPYAGKSASQAVLSRMQFTLHATRRTTHGALHLVLAMSAWSVKTLRAGPSRHCRDARVYGHTTRVVLDNEYTPRRLHNIWALEKRATHGCVVVCLCGEVQDTTKNHDH